MSEFEPIEVNYIADVFFDYATKCQISPVVDDRHRILTAHIADLLSDQINKSAIVLPAEYLIFLFTVYLSYAKSMKENNLLPVGDKTFDIERKIHRLLFEMNAGNN